MVFLTHKDTKKMSQQRVIERGGVIKGNDHDGHGDNVWLGAIGGGLERFAKNLAWGPFLEVN